MIIFTNLWTNWTLYEKFITLIMFASILLIILGGIWFITNNKKIILFTTISLTSSALLTILAIWFSSAIFEVVISTHFFIIPLLVLIAEVLNIGTIVGYYANHYKSKNFDLNGLKNEYVSDSTKFSILITLFCSVAFAFTSSNLQLVIGLTAFISVSMLWINYFLLYRIVK